ncbi:hypothetical protein Syun_018837 [Stephania yunnanensis]|uniref:Uncharacterized protein n=1 Tax=Stephania yunnanensis TaxID=152371 RepID=A0AAP0ITM7_9MAGN
MAEGYIPKESLKLATQLVSQGGAEADQRLRRSRAERRRSRAEPAKGEDRGAIKAAQAKSELLSADPTAAAGGNGYSFAHKSCAPGGNEARRPTMRAQVRAADLEKGEATAADLRTGEATETVVARRRLMD